MIYNRQAFWRETMRPGRFLIFDARLSVFVLLFMLHLQVWTGLLVLAVAVLFWVCEKVWNLDFANMLRLARSSLAGPQRPARGFAAQRYPADFGFETPAMVEAAHRAPQEGRSSRLNPLSHRRTA